MKSIYHYGRSLALLLAMIMLLPGSVVLVAMETKADSNTLIAAKLPSARTHTSAVWDGGQYAYVFGGRSSAGLGISEIVRFDAGSESATPRGATLSHGKYYVAAAWANGKAYLFGGAGDGSTYPTIFRYDPATDTTTQMGATLPTPRHSMSAVWNGASYIYLFGGSVGCSSPSCDQILRYDVVNDDLDNLGHKLDIGMESGTAVWANGKAYVFGGWNWTGSTGDVTAIQRYDPTTGSVDIMGATVPTKTRFTSAVWDGAYAYIFGGFLNPVLRYDPVGDELTEMSASGGLVATSAVWTGSKAYLFGGHISVASDEIRRYTLEPGPPVLTATNGPQLGEISLSWTPPAANTYSGALFGYDVHRRLQDGGSYGAPVNVGNNVNHVDTNPGPGERWCYKVSARSAAGDGTRSAEKCARAPATPAAPPSASADPGPGFVIVRWSTPADDGGLPLTLYHIYRANTPGGPYSKRADIPAGPGPEHVYEDATCLLGTTCYYVVTASNAGGEGAQSQEADEAGTAVASYEETFEKPIHQVADMTSLWHVYHAEFGEANSCRSLSGTHSAAFSHKSTPCPSNLSDPSPNYTNAVPGNLVTLPFELPPGRVSRLSYASWFHTESGCLDSKEVAIRTTSDLLGETGDDWHTIVVCEKGTTLPTFAGGQEIQKIWYGRLVVLPDTWPDKVGSRVQLRFSLAPDRVGDTGEGWYVDDIRVTSEQTP